MMMGGLFKFNQKYTSDRFPRLDSLRTRRWCAVPKTSTEWTRNEENNDGATLMDYNTTINHRCQQYNGWNISSYMYGGGFQSLTSSCKENTSFSLWGEEFLWSIRVGLPLNPTQHRMLSQTKNMEGHHLMQSLLRVRFLELHIGGQFSLVCSSRSLTRREFVWKN